MNNTGGPPPTPASGQDPAVWTKHFQSMVVFVIDRVLPGMRARKWGRIVTSTSSGVVAPIPNLAISNALRMTLVGWSKSLAREVGKDGITANIVLPGRIATGRIAFLDEQKAKRENRPVADITAESTASIPLGRYGDPQEYGDVVAFLASERAAYLTGSTIRVDGGLIASVQWPGALDYLRQPVDLYHRRRIRPVAGGFGSLISAFSAWVTVLHVGCGTVRRRRRP